MGLGRGRTEHAGPRDMTRKHGHWGTTEQAKEWASRARRLAGAAELREQSQDDDQPSSGAVGGVRDLEGEDPGCAPRVPSSPRRP